MSVPPIVAPKPHLHKEDFKSAALKQRPKAFYKAVNPTTLESDNEYDCVNEYDYVDFTVSPPTSSNELVASAVPLNTAVHTLQDQAATLERRMTKLSSETSALQSNLHQLNALLEAVCSEVKQLKQQVQQQRGADGSSRPMATNTQEETPDREQNKKYLSSLDQIQVLQLLDKMGLKQYKEIFQEESINGEVLVECDTETLQQDLKVTSRIHRVRLLKLISGQHSAQKLLQGSITTLV